MAKGGEAAGTERRACLCNGLTANIGLGQRQKWGREPSLLTAGDDLVRLSLGSATSPSYTAEDVLSYLRGETKTPTAGHHEGGPVPAGDEEARA